VPDSQQEQSLKSDLICLSWAYAPVRAKPVMHGQCDAKPS